MASPEQRIYSPQGAKPGIPVEKPVRRDAPDIPTIPERVPAPAEPVPVRPIPIPDPVRTPREPVPTRR